MDLSHSTIMKHIYTLLFFLLSGLHLISQEIQIGQGLYEGVTVSSSSDDETGERTLMASGYLPNLNAASRFLSQATLGASYDEIVALSQRSIENWMDEQMSLQPSFRLEDYIYNLHERKVDSINLYFPDPEDPHTIFNTGLDDWYFDIAWFQYAMTSNDDLRQRIALALSEIFVISRESDFENNPYALAHYYDLLVDNAFGNYRSLMDSITYNPAMGVYLSFMNNPATDTMDGDKIFPDQNYAREIMQLFSIGLYELNNDGTEKIDAQGQSIPTYSNTDIEGLSGVFTGLSWGDGDYFGTRSKNDFSYSVPMQYYPFKVKDRRVVPAHEPGAKTFLGLTIPDRDIYVYGEQDIQDALDHLFVHPNVGPFISRRLIQRLVTSNPSSDYIDRVASIFNNNGSGVRGDLGAVVRAILLDREARDCGNSTEPSFGMLREPFIRYINLVKAMKIDAPGGIYRNSMSRIYNYTEQKPLYSRTVFNFFQPDFQPSGILQENNLYAPEFQITNSVTLVGYLNLFNDYLNDNRRIIDYNNYFGNENFKPDERPELDFTFLETMTDDDQVPFLVDYLNVLFAHGSINSYSVNIIEETIRDYDTNAEDKAQLAVFLVMASPDYLINR
ncbi:MAG: hypothetical protein ACI9FN_001114 [Saprospiraceae bacterium]|jgi:uncharacterized protein (DUF1800 family)